MYLTEVRTKIDESSFWMYVCKKMKQTYDQKENYDYSSEYQKNGRSTKCF